MRLFFLIIGLQLVNVSIAISQNKNNPYPEFKPIEAIQSAKVTDCQLEIANGEPATKFEQLLSFTHPELKQFMVDEDLLEIYVSASQLRGEYFLDMRYIFNTTKGIESYGSHSKGAPVKVSLLNKETLFFKNLKSAKGKVKEKEGVSMLTASYLLDEYEVKQLLKSPILAMEVTYLYGTESYPVQNITLIGDQLQCLENNQ